MLGDRPSIAFAIDQPPRCKNLSKLLYIKYGIFLRNFKAQSALLGKRFRKFPYRFEATHQEYREVLKCQIGTLEMGKYSKYLPYAFTEQGVAMLSSVLNSDRAIRVNIQIIRAFVQLRKMLLTNADLRRKIEQMEKKYDKEFAIVFDAIRQLLEPPKETRAIGFHI